MDCGATHPIRSISRQIDEAIEEELAFVPLDRL